ncbi:MAG: hypothetical protein IID31_07660 [Planctomycetes bacterium]|nr:hypothetical protein [Planctomycetota bacterium]
MTNAEHKGGTPGPDPERLKLEGDWEERVDDALGKKKPGKGWPKPKAKRDVSPDVQPAADKPEQDAD